MKYNIISRVWNPGNGTHACGRCSGREHSGLDMGQIFSLNEVYLCVAFRTLNDEISNWFTNKRFICPYFTYKLASTQQVDEDQLILWIINDYNWWAFNTFCQKIEYSDK